MANKWNQSVLKMPPETYDRLKRIKDKYDCTFSDVIAMLIELEMKNNYILDIYDFEFISRTGEGVFRVLKKREDIVFEYFGENGYSNHIKHWLVDDETKRLFKKFVKDYPAGLLFNIEVSMEFKKFVILRR